MDENSYETSMVKSISSENILPLSIVFKDGQKCFESNISGLISLKEYLYRRNMNAGDISAIIIQISNVVETSKNYLLSEGDIMLELGDIYVDEERQELKFCIVPGSENDFEKGLRNLIFELVIHADGNDADSLKLGFRLLKISSEPEFKLHDIMDVIRKNKTAGSSMQAVGIVTPEPVAIMGNAAVPADIGIRRGAAAAEGPEDAAEAAGPAGMEFTESFMSPENAVGAENAENKTGHGFLKGMLLSQAVLLAGVFVVFLLKGAGLVLKMLPFYIILALCVAAYYIVDSTAKQKKTEQSDNLPYIPS